MWNILDYYIHSQFFNGTNTDEYVCMICLKKLNLLKLPSCIPMNIYKKSSDEIIGSEKIAEISIARVYE